VSAYTSIQDTTEGRQVDFLMEIGMEASAAFWKNATTDDVISSLEAWDEAWPVTRLIELRDKLQAVILESPALPGPRLFMTNKD
jgi:hypothetical protein